MNREYATRFQPTTSISTSTSAQAASRREAVLHSEPGGGNQEKRQQQEKDEVDLAGKQQGEQPQLQQPSLPSHLRAAGNRTA